MLKLSFPTRKLKGSLIKITDKYKNFENKTLQAYGVTNKEGIVITGKNISDDTSNYTVITGKTFVYNPYRINVGSIGLTDDDFKGIVSPAYVAFKVKDDILPEFLLLYLKSSLGINLIKWYGDRGGVRSALRFNDLEKIDFPDLSYEQQEEALKNINKFIKIQNTLNQEMENQVTYISKFRQSILQDAIQGKLVPQDPTDEPASELLKRIKSKKEQLIKEGKIKKEKFIINDEIPPYNIPSSWSWVRWNEILSYDKYSMKRGPFGSALRKDFFVSKGIRVFEQYNAINDDPYWARYYITKEKYEELKAFTANAGDLLISCSGVTLGRITEIPNDTDMGIINQALLKLNLNKKLISNAYFKMLFKSKYMQDLIFEKALGSAIPNMVGVVELKRIFIPLPPKEEQKRIVARVDELMQLCDKLESENNNAQKSSSELLQTLMQKYFTQEV